MVSDTCDEVVTQSVHVNRPSLLPASVIHGILTRMANPLTKLKPKRRWLQFSLRTVLVLVTLLCVALSLWVVPIERQRRAVAAIEALGGSVYYVERNPAASQSFTGTFLRSWVPPDYFDEVDQVDFALTPITDARLAPLKELRSLHKLNLFHTQITDAGLAHLQGLTALQVLYLSHTQVTDAGLAQLQGLRRLQKLSLHDTRVTDTGLALLQRLPDLKALGLTNTQVTDAGLAHLRGLTGLQELSLTGTLVTDAGLVHLRGLTGLQELYLANTKVTDVGLVQLRKALPNCKIVLP